MKHYFNSLKKTVWLLSSVLILASCESDVWKEHYSYNPGSDVSVKSLAETIESTPGTDNFVKALKNTYMYNGDKQLFLTYWDLLGESQFMTVWLPTESSISAEQWAEYTKDKKDPSKDHKKVGTEFILNHIARFSHTVSPDTKEKIYMLSEKAFRSKPDNMGGIHYQKTNIRCTNGILHQLDGYLDYRPSIYEYIITAPQYQDVFGKWFAQYTKEEVDPKKSVASGINSDGEMEYVDSVMVQTSVLMKKYGLINQEDSNYVMVMTTPEVWSDKYDLVKDYYQFESYVAGADSLQNFQTQSAMITDAFFNMNLQKSPEDSVVSTMFKQSERKEKVLPYHVFYKPYQPGGLFAANDSVLCSNGVIYIWNEWPFVDTLTYLRPIEMQVEDIKLMDETGFTLNKRMVTSVNGDKLSKNIFVKEMFGGSKDWKATFAIEDNLKGKYEVKLVIVPNSSVGMPNKFHPSVTYIAADGSTVKLIDVVSGSGPNKKPNTFVNNMEKIDTISIGIAEFPACNYKVDTKSRITIQSYIYGKDANSYTEKLWLDCILLEPVVE